MKIINSEFKIPKSTELSSEYFETFLKLKNIDYLRWAIVDFDDKNFILNVAHKEN